MVADRLRRLCSENVGVVLQHTLHPGHLTPRIHLRLSHGLQVDLVRYYRPEWGRQRRVRKIVALVPQQLRRFFFREAGHREKTKRRQAKQRAKTKKEENGGLTRTYVISLCYHTYTTPLCGTSRGGGTSSSCFLIYSRLLTASSVRSVQPSLQGNTSAGYIVDGVPELQRENMHTSGRSYRS